MGHRESEGCAECKWVGYRRVDFCNGLGEGGSLSHEDPYRPGISIARTIRLLDLSARLILAPTGPAQSVDRFLRNPVIVPTGVGFSVAQTHVWNKRLVRYAHPTKVLVDYVLRITH